MSPDPEPQPNSKFQKHRPFFVLEPGQGKEIAHVASARPRSTFPLLQARVGLHLSMTATAFAGVCDLEGCASAGAVTFRFAQPPSCLWPLREATLAVAVFLC